MLRNVQTLKLAAEAGIYVEWGHLFGFPGEHAEDYASIIDLIPKIVHLQPPVSLNRVRADRFSPYFDSPDEFSIKIRPLPAYAFIYLKSDDETIKSHAYHFDIETPEEPQLASALATLSVVLQDWVDRGPSTALTIATSANGTTVVEDRRHVTATTSTLSPCETGILMMCMEMKSILGVIEALGQTYGQPFVELSINALLQHGFLLREGESVLSLPLRQPGLQRSPLKREIRTSLEVSFFSYPHRNPQLATQ